jgi:transposase, IS5 family
MLGKSKAQNQGDLFLPLLSSFIDTNHELVRLGDKLDWSGLEKGLRVYYSDKGQSSMPIRFMEGCMLLKHLYNLGDESLAKAWVMNPYMQYFCGESVFQHKFPCDPSDFVHFRKRMGDTGIGVIFEYSVLIHGKSALEGEVLSDTTVQENNTTFPTDSKLAAKVIENCERIAKREKIVQRQSYSRTRKALLRASYNSQHPKRAKEAKKAMKKLRTIGGRVVRELKHKLKDKLGLYEERLALYERALSQERHTKDKVYSLHKPHTACIAKGKAGIAYEFGNKVGVIVGSKNLVITAIRAFMGNPHDANTIEPLIKQQQELFHKIPKEIVYDRAAINKKEVLGVKISSPTKPKAADSQYQKQKLRKKFRRRAAVEALFSALKHQHRMKINFLDKEEGTTMNAFLAAAAWNLKRWLNATFLLLFELLKPQKYFYTESEIVYS